MKKYFSSHSVSSVKDPERLLVKQSSVLEFMLSNKYIQLLNAVIHSSTDVKRTVLVTALCSTPALASYSDKESARWLIHRFFLNFVKLKFPYVVIKWQRHMTHYSEILEKTALVLGKIFAAFHIPCFVPCFTRYDVAKRL